MNIVFALTVLACLAAVGSCSNDRAPSEAPSCSGDVVNGRASLVAANTAIDGIRKRKQQLGVESTNDYKEAVLNEEIRNAFRILAGESTKPVSQYFFPGLFVCKYRKVGSDAPHVRRMTCQVPVPTDFNEPLTLQALYFPGDNNSPGQFSTTILEGDKQVSYSCVIEQLRSRVLSKPPQ